MIINSISENFKKKVDINNYRKIHTYWFEQLDILYFSNEKIIIKLSKFDKKIINKYIHCYDKLKILSFNKNIIIKY